VGKRLSSPRFRRRVAWFSCVAVGVALVVAVIVVFPTGTGPKQVFDKKPPKVYKLPDAVALDRNGKTEVIVAASSFVKTAVRRDHLDASWSMTTPGLRQGLTRSQWDKGDIPVVPYPAVGIGDWQIDWSYRNDVALDVVLVPAHGSHLHPKLFMIELKRFGGADGHRWLVASWQPKGVSEASMLADQAKGQPALPKSTALSGRWLLAPLGLVLGLIVLLPIFLVVREWLRTHRAEQVHRRSAGL
jgi:hypothetical protein